MRTTNSLVVIAFALAGSLGAAAAQSIPQPAYPAYPPPSYSSAPLPPADIPQAAVPAGPPYERAPYGQRDDQQAGGSPYESYPPASRPSLEANDSAAPRSFSGFGGDPAPRPPASIADIPGSDDVTGSVRSPAPGTARSGSGPAGPIAGLPPEDQPEQGPPKELPPQFRRQLVDYVTREPAGTIVIDTPNTYLYLVLGQGKAMRYGIGVGREGFTWTGTERVRRMSEWPDWFPPKEMIERQPYLPRFMAGGDTNPLGARALYLGNTLYRIHGTNQPSTIGTFVSSGCIRLTNQDISDLYGRVSVGTRVVVLPGSGSASASTQDSITR